MKSFNLTPIKVTPNDNTTIPTILQISTQNWNKEEESLKKIRKLQKLCWELAEMISLIWDVALDETSIEEILKVLNHEISFWSFP